MSDTAAASPEPGMPRRRRRGSESGAPPEAAALDTAAVSHPGEPDALLAALQHNWRKVASTDNLLVRLGRGLRAAGAPACPLACT